MSSLIKGFFSDIKKNILTSPLRTSVPFSLIILGVEKVADLEFSCPCNPKVNTLFAAFMFIGPALFALTIIVYVTNPCKHGWRCSCGCTYIRNLLSCLIPPAVWVVLLFLDGQYVACGFTYWNGSYFSDDEKPPMKWCEGKSLQASKDKGQTQLYLAQSQIAGLIALAVSSGLAMIVYCCTCSGQEAAENSQPDPQRATEMGPVQDS